MLRVSQDHASGYEPLYEPEHLIIAFPLWLSWLKRPTVIHRQSGDRKFEPSRGRTGTVLSFCFLSHCICPLILDIFITIQFIKYRTRFIFNY